VARAYGIYNEANKIATRTTFYIGANGKILHIDTAVKTAAHGTDVAAKLAELGVAKKK
jgi:thioredoxin-dependent peroxiredoxin